MFTMFSVRLKQAEHTEDHLIWWHEEVTQMSCPLSRYHFYISCLCQFWPQNVSFFLIPDSQSMTVKKFSFELCNPKSKDFELYDPKSKYMFWDHTFELCDYEDFEL